MVSAASQNAQSTLKASIPKEVEGNVRHAQLLVFGGGPGGYTAAFRAADLGLSVVLVERESTLGGVCLNVGCIPSKALLHVALIVNEARALAKHGVEFGAPRFDLTKIAAFKDGVVGKLTQGLAGLAKKRGVEVLRGTAKFVTPDRVAIEKDGVTATWTFDDCIVATGSRPVEIPGFPTQDERLMDSTDALRLETVPERLLVLGGGIIGLEMATVYHSLGSRVTIVELLPRLIPGCDPDLVRPLERILRTRYENIFIETRVTKIEPEANGLRVFFEGAKAPASDLFDRVLVAVGRKPNSDCIGAENAGLALDARGFLIVDAKQRTNVPHIYAIGDIVGQPMLAHKATHQGKTAAEVIAGLPAAFDALAIPSVAYTDPEVAWMGLTEEAAQAQSITVETASFPWAASGRALGIDRSEGSTKLIIDPETRRLLGAGMVGPNAGELIAEAVLALELGADAEDIALTVHPHPTLSETFALGAEILEGSITDLYTGKKR